MHSGTNSGNDCAGPNGDAATKPSPKPAALVLGRLRSVTAALATGIPTATTTMIGYPYVRSQSSPSRDFADTRASHRAFLVPTTIRETAARVRRYDEVGLRITT